MSPNNDKAHPSMPQEPSIGDAVTQEIFLDSGAQPVSGSDPMCKQGVNDMPRSIDRHQLRELLLGTADGEIISLLVTGYSMQPTLLNRRSTVFLTRTSVYTPHRGDIVFFLRPSGDLVLHRVVRLLPDGALLINGDAQKWTETIHPAQVLARVDSFKRKRRVIQATHHLYRLYVRLWMPLRPLHPGLARLYYIWSRIPYKLFPVHMAKRDKKRREQEGM